MSTTLTAGQHDLIEFFDFAVHRVGANLDGWGRQTTACTAWNRLPGHRCGGRGGLAAAGQRQRTAAPSTMWLLRCVRVHSLWRRTDGLLLMTGAICAVGLRCSYRRRRWSRKTPKSADNRVCVVDRRAASELRARVPNVNDEQQRVVITRTTTSGRTPARHDVLLGRSSVAARRTTIGATAATAHRPRPVPTPPHTHG